MADALLCRDNASCGESHSSEKLPYPGLLTLACCAFIALMTEIMPAGMLSGIASRLHVSDSLAGQFITAFAIGALAAALPVTWLTRGVRRRTLLVSTMAGFAAANLATALSDIYAVSIIARFFAGICGGTIWSLLAGYAVRMSPSHLSGRAIAIAASGATVALVFGVPLGSLLSGLVGWQGTFYLASALSAILVLWTLRVMPDFPGQAKQERLPLIAVFRMTGVRAVLLVVLTFIAAHNILYIYIEPLLAPAGLSGRVDLVFFLLGIGSLAGLWLAGALVDRHPRALALFSVTIFATATLFLGWFGGFAAIVYPIVMLWGLGFGFGTITQTALSRLTGKAVDVAQAMFTTAWNLAVAAGGAIGGFMLTRTGMQAFAWMVFAILMATLTGIVAMNRAAPRA